MTDSTLLSKRSIAKVIGTPPSATKPTKPTSAKAAKRNLSHIAALKSNTADQGIPNQRLHTAVCMCFAG
jgi:hypothetical protein